MGIDLSVASPESTCKLTNSNLFLDFLTPEERNVSRQAFASLLFTKQFYHYIVKDWLEGDPSMPTPPQERLSGRNIEWKHLFNRDVISMPDKWEYPWVCFYLSYQII